MEDDWLPALPHLWATKQPIMKQLLFFVLVSIRICATAQVAVNMSGSAPASSAMLDVSSTNKGMLMPRMTTMQRKAVANPEIGLLVYDLDRQTPYLFDGSEWRPLMFTSNDNLPLVERAPEGDDPGARGWGTSVAMWENYVVMGGESVSNGQGSQGAAYIYVKTNGTWTLQQKLLASNGAPGDRFGASVAIYNDLVVVAAPTKTVLGKTGAGAIYVFKRTGTVWAEIQVITTINPQLWDQFGYCVALTAGKLIVGAPYTDYNGLTNSGTAFFYEFLSNQFALTKQFKAQQPIIDGEFGRAVGIDGNDVVIGYPKYLSAPEGRTGSVNVFTYQPVSGGWSETVLLSDIKQAGMEFGAAVAIHKDVILAGAPFYDLVLNVQTKIYDVGRINAFKRPNNIFISDYNYEEIQPQEQGQLGYKLAITQGYKLFSTKGLNGTEPTVIIEYPSSKIKKLTDLYKKFHGFGRAIAIFGTNFAITGSGRDGAGNIEFGFVD
jgi:hypothetical protein